MKLIVGLGNPGTVYEDTRHNIGFWVTDRIVQNFGAKPIETKRWFRKRLSKLYAGEFQGERILCLYPLTYMNRSGIAVSDIAMQYDVDVGDIIVVYDDFNLPLGRIRIRSGGTAGGHNGLASIIDELGTKDIPRVRLGIHNEAIIGNYADAADFVLSAFEPDEKEITMNMIQRAHDAILMIVKEGIPKAMNSFNTAADGNYSTNQTNNRES